MIEIQGIERVEMTKRINQIQRRIAEIEEKIGMLGVGSDFQVKLEREIAKQAKLDVKPTQAVADVQKPPKKPSDVTKPVNENAAANSAKVAKALRESENVEPAQKALPGEEALPGKINQPQAPAQIKPVEVPDTEIEIPNRDEKSFEDNYVGKNAEVIPVEDLIMQAAYEYGVEPQVVQGIIAYINQHQTPAQISSDLSAESNSVEDLIAQAARDYGVDPQLVRAIAIAESDMNQDEISDVGAIGVMQLMPETAAGLGVNPYNTDENIAAGTKYLRQMLDTFDGNVPLAVAAYNAGPGAVKRYGGIPPYSETKNYVGRVMDMYR